MMCGCANMRMCRWGWVCEYADEIKDLKTVYAIFKSLLLFSY